MFNQPAGTSLDKTSQRISMLACYNKHDYFQKFIFSGVLHLFTAVRAPKTSKARLKQ